MPKPRKRSPSKDFQATPAFKEGALRLGRTIRKLREEHGWTLEAAEEHLDFDWKHLGKIEIGDLNVTIATLLRLADAFDRDLDVRFLRRRPQRRH